MTTTIQRYMDLPKFISLLQTNSLYLAKMSIFEDALEGGLTATDYLKTSNDLARLDLAINGLRPVANEAEHTRTHRLENLLVHSQPLPQLSHQLIWRTLKAQILKFKAMCREYKH